MAANERARLVRQLPVGWALTLAFDVLATVVASLGLCGLGLLLPGVEEDYGPATGPTSPTALGLFAAALGLIASLAATATLLSRARAERARCLPLWLSAGRLALLLLTAATFVAYGILVIEP
ncbi:hypothetical protein [Streptomyces sp. NBC_01207]|uniref:hypothetical protein n=1 Tax=Streptomyces sp. NBC_01207 TaxID=2903772 RepID=UPI002E118B86|nr:hypothetical protein OG457_43675 [Streptomyces sp. NBC_01207]WTA23731.1 hypothetical protein OG365_37350 [Streptomyces sp. NBC_00853]